MTTRNTPWIPPADFPSWAVIESNEELAVRYGTSRRSVANALMRLPETVQAARYEYRQTRSIDRDQMRKFRKKAKAIEQARELASVTFFREVAGDHCERAIRSATKDFEVHYCDVADRNPQWPICGYAA